MEDFNSLEANIKSSLLATIRSANSLGNEDLAFHRSLDSSVGTTLDQQNARLLGLAERLLGVSTANTELVRPPRLKDIDSVEGNWKAVVDVVDSLLERADTALDEFTGAVKRLSPGIEQAAPSKPPKVSRIAAALKTQELEKPQLHFDHVPKNDEVLPFKPLLQSKPHAAVPLETSPIASDEDTQESYAYHLISHSRLGVLDHEDGLKHLFSFSNKASRFEFFFPTSKSLKLRCWNIDPNVPNRYPHPYQLEIEQYRYPSSVYTISEPIMYQPFESTTATFVDTEEALYEMLEELKQAKEIAIDLEHHDSRTYIGIVSLMQISTRDKDWVVDTLQPWRRKMQCLNEVFADPGILKILHGAYMDIVWLQRDLGLYIVALFDTHYASRALGYTGGSLAFLLKKFINFDAQKQYQMADWRIRPLPQELFDYARSDTHFLLYIFDNMRNELVQRSDFSKPDHEGDKLWDVLQKSTEVALQRYEHPIYDAELGQGAGGWYKMLSRTPALFSKEQFSVFRAVHKWRDEVAREQDDSTHYVMPNHQVLSIAKAMPPNRLALLGVAQPTTQTVKLRADELVSVIAKAKEAGKEGPAMMDILNKIEPQAPRKSAPVQAAPAEATPEKTGPTASASGTASMADYKPSTSLPLRSSTSTFWGSAFDNSAHQKREMSSTSNVSLAVPLPPLTAEIFANPNEVEAEPPTPEPIPAPAVEVPADDDTFILKERNRKRKRTIDKFANVEDDGMAANTDEVSLTPVSGRDQEQREKAERKAARKAAKKAEKEAKRNGEEDSEIEDDTPFDYAAAPSILNPPREPRKSAKERKKEEKQKNPYATSLDAPKGMPRNQKEGPGRSMTFRN
ncbi:Exosome complex exonuclease rrp6 [Fulvia fulva]|nr:Exosome complex exonuclease rrp6 [Fulvia fulva]